MEKQEKAVITVVGKDMVGILAKVSGICAEKGVNVLEVTDEFAKLGEENNLKIHVMHEDIFNSMHRI